MTSAEVREAFLNFFSSKLHQTVPSAPMVVKNDPTLMFTNAGMNQFKDIFLGNSPVKYKRIANTQKCLRVSGKHNDLEEVGHDTYHHTMFEMLGNWSFGDYFKAEAIAWAWEFLVDVLKLNPDNLYASYFEGSASEGIAKDDEALEMWSKYLPKERILPGSKKDNFWEMGESGPCGPCTEIHIDLRGELEKESVPGYKLVNNGHPQVVEIWNLVFIQFNRKADGTLSPLPAKHVDTGMGFERLCMALQGKTSNYDTDVFQPIIQKLAEISGAQYGRSEPQDVAMRVVADHLRAVAFSIADGQLPSNVKAGYVIRRILRRAVRYGYTFLNIREPFMHRLVPTLTQQMGAYFPELVAQSDLVSKVMHEEEATFLRTLENGIRLLDGLIDKARRDRRTKVSGADAFVLYDTYGFPLDLTELILRENGMEVEREEFEKEMSAQKQRSRADASVEAQDWVELLPVPGVEFIGYDSLVAKVRISRYRVVRVKGKDQLHLVFDRTPFYAESGGQVGDSGTITAGGETVRILNTLRENELIVHLSEGLPSDPSAEFEAKVDMAKRQNTANNHTATHLMHNALREVLGKHVEQKGSLVCPDYLRFDFAHFNRMTDEEVREVERRVNAAIRLNIPVEEHRAIPMERAQSMGAIALFGEKYGESVRAIRFGPSVELCGGTHVAATGSIGCFKIVSEGAISAGVRRIEAISGEGAEEYLYQQVDTIRRVRQELGTTGDLIQGLARVISENNDLRNEVESLYREKALIEKGVLKAKAQQIGGITAIASITSITNADMLKDIAYQLRNEVDNLFLVLGSQNEGKAMLTIMIDDSLVASKGLNASSIIRDAAKEIQGGGGGQPYFATAGGKNPDGLEKAIDRAIRAIQ